MMFYQNRNNIFFEIEILRHKYRINIVKTNKRDKAKQLQEHEQHRGGQNLVPLKMSLSKNS